MNASVGNPENATHDGASWSEAKAAELTAHFETLSHTGFPARLGDFSIVGIAPGHLVTRIETGEPQLNLNGVVHGGVLFTLADFSAGLCTVTLAGHARMVTAEMKINYLRACPAGPVECEIRAVKPGRRISVFQADLYAAAGEERRHVATGLVTYAGTGD